MIGRTIALALIYTVAIGMMIRDWFTGKLER